MRSLHSVNSNMIEFEEVVWCLRISINGPFLSYGFGQPALICFWVLYQTLCICLISVGFICVHSAGYMHENMVYELCTWVFSIFEEFIHKYS